MTYHDNNDSGSFNDVEFLDHESCRRSRNSRERLPGRKRRPDDDMPLPTRIRTRRPPRTERDQAFKCGHCKQFIGAPISGGRHRNHCPNCLYSKHVDRSMPGDRRSDCGSLMAPVGVLNRRNGEQMILHRCLGCGKEAPNRIAADDDPTALLHISPVQPLHGRSTLLAPEFAVLEIEYSFSLNLEDGEEDRIA